MSPKTLALGDRMKIYEKELNINIEPHESFIVRLDGKNFSRFTKGFQKPFDGMFIRTMCLTMHDLVKKFEAQTGYTHSDEITLVFDNAIPDGEQINNDIHKYCHMYNGRTQKILSIMASYCSVKFNHHLNILLNEYDGEYAYKQNFIDIIKSNEQIFDARIMKFNGVDNYEILNHQLWRSVHDCERNAIQSYAHTHFGSSKIMNKHCGEMKDLLLSEKGINWDDVPLYLKHGIYCKKILVEKKIGNESIIRSQYMFKMFKICFSDENLNMLLSKYWDDNCCEVKLDEII